MALSKLALALAVAPSAALVAPSAKVSSTKLSAEGKLDEIPEAENRFTSRLATQEGFCLDLPGALAPMGQWDPAGFTSQASDNDIRRYREAETQHGRVAMLAVIGFLVAESWHPLFADGQTVIDRSVGCIEQTDHLADVAFELQKTQCRVSEPVENRMFGTSFCCDLQLCGPM